MISKLRISFLVFLITSFGFGQVTYNGNGNNGFGGALGK